MKQTHSKVVFRFLLNRCRPQPQPLDRQVVFSPRDHRPTSTEDLVIQLSNNPFLLVDHVTETPILTLRRPEASPAVFNFEAADPLLL